MTSSAESLRDLRQQFDVAVELEGEARDAFLNSLPESIRAQLIGLLNAVDTPTRHALAPSIDDRVPEGERLGPYTIVRMIGRGGMGTVYEAVRNDDQYKKRVAIKLVQGGLDLKLASARFRRERQILANLEHRNIATLLDGGITTDGRPYLVMEFVEGEPITTWCDRQVLSVASRVSLLRQAASAVHHAHRNLVIHRDLKPGNILVAADGTVKLLDFGIAKLLDDAPDVDALPVTRGESRVFTPEYASPEQFLGVPLTTASDIYSLGVVAYELLCGQRPHGGATQTLGQLERSVLESPAPAPSTVVTDDAAHKRGERDADRLRRRLRGDLDDIVLTAVRAEPKRRYESAEAFGEDLRLHLAGMPIATHRDWTAYLVRKFVRRNVSTVAASVLGISALIGGAVASTIQARRAVAEQQTTEQVNSFLRVILSSVKPTTGGRDVPVSELLDSAAVRLGTKLATRPDIRAPLEAVIGESYQSLGLLAPAEAHLTVAAKLRRALNGEHSDPFAVAQNNLGLLYIGKGEYDRADTTLRAALAIHQRVHPKPDTLTAHILSNLGSAANGTSDYAASVRLHSQALQIIRDIADPASDMVATTTNNLAVAYGNQGNWVQAESLHREVVGLLKSRHSKPTPVLADAMNALAGALDIQHKSAAAESAYVETLALRKTLLGVNHPDYTWTLFSYSMVLFELKRFDEAAKHSREILALRGNALPESHPSIPAALQTLGRCLDQLGDHVGGEQALKESLELRRKYLGKEHWLVASSEGMLGEHYTKFREYAQAERVLLDADRILRASLGSTHQNTYINVKRLVTLYDAWKRPQEAAAQRAKLPPMAP